LHKIKLLRIKPRISAEPPKFFKNNYDTQNPHYFQNKHYKGIILFDEKIEKNREISYINGLLMQKLTSINEGFSLKNPKLYRTSSTLKSLNDTTWKRKRATISKENTGLLHRISSAKSIYSSRNLDEHFEKHRTLSRMLSQNSGIFIEKI